MSKNFGLEAFGAGIGLRHDHFSELLAYAGEVRWLEIISENFMGYGGRSRAVLKELSERYPVIGHGVCLSIGSTDPLDFDYLKALKGFLREINSPWTSDHLCFTMVDHTNLSELIPLPFTTETVNHVAERIRVVQDFLEMPFLVENVTRYITISDREMSETEFISGILEKANCGLLLDVTNVFLNSKFHKFEPLEFIDKLPLERVGQMHLAGMQIAKDGSFIDSHDAPVPKEIWQLFSEVIKRTGPSSVLIERDASIPPLTELLAEADQAQRYMQ